MQIITFALFAEKKWLEKLVLLFVQVLTIQIVSTDEIIKNKGELNMIKKIINHIEYKKKVKLLKMIAVNQLTNIIVNNADYVNGFQKLLLTMSKSDDAVELQKLLNDYVDLVKKTKIVNDVINKEENK